MNAAIARLRKTAETDENVLTHVEFAQILVDNRRAALDLTVNQIRELAAALLIIDHQLNEANRRIANMMIAEDTPPPSRPEPVIEREVVHVPLVTGGDPALATALEALVTARHRLEANRYSAGENTARQAFEKAAITVTNIFTPKQRK